MNQELSEMQYIKWTQHVSKIHQQLAEPWGSVYNVALDILVASLLQVFNNALLGPVIWALFTEFTNRFVYSHLELLKH